MKKYHFLSKTFLVVSLSLITMFSLTNETNYAKADESLLYKLDFSNENDFTHNSGSTSFEDAIVVDGNQLSVEEGPKGKKALNFPGNTKDVNYLSLPNSIFENQDQITISGWYYLTHGVEAYLGEIGIYSIDNDMSFRSDPFASYRGGAYIYAVGNPNNINLNTRVKPVYDAWYHMSYVFDGINHQFKVIQNGNEVLSQNVSEDFTPSKFYSINSHFYLGQSSYRGYHGEGVE